MEGENEAKSWTCVSMWKSLTEDSWCRSGLMYFRTASSIFQAEGDAEAAKRENVTWYVEAYLKARVVRFSMACVVS